MSGYTQCMQMNIYLYNRYASSLSPLPSLLVYIQWMSMDDFFACILLTISYLVKPLIFVSSAVAVIIGLSIIQLVLQSNQHENLKSHDFTDLR